MIHDAFERISRPRPRSEEPAARRRLRESAEPPPPALQPRRVGRRTGATPEPSALETPPTSEPREVPFPITTSASAPRITGGGRRAAERAERRAAALQPSSPAGAERGAVALLEPPSPPALPPAPDLDPTSVVAARHARLTKVAGAIPIGALTTIASPPPVVDAPSPASATPLPERAHEPEPDVMSAQRRRHTAHASAVSAGADAGPPPRGWFLNDEADRRGRGVWLLLAFAAMAATIGVKLVDVQVRQSHDLAAAATHQHVATVTIPAHRGRILDSTGRLLASDLQLYAVYADPGVIPQALRHDDAVALAPVLRMGTQKLDDLLNSAGDFVPLAHGVTEDQKAALARLGIYGIIANPEDRRQYDVSPVAGASLASNLLGFVDHDGHGQYGVENYYDAVLRGQDGVDSTVRDLAGNAITFGAEKHIPAREGSDLRLGLDSRVQYYAEQALAQTVTQSGAESGSVLVMDTATGSLRAMVDYPSYNANTYASADLGRVRDLSIDGTYEPGSVMKVVTFAAGLNKGVISPTEVINEHNTNVGGFTIHDWDGRPSHNGITFQWVLDDSLNNGAIQVMARTGKDDFYNNLLKFGIGSPTGVDLAGEQNLPLRPQPTWTDVDYATASFGQQVSVTPIQMLAAINAVGNGGLWVQPHAVDAVVDPATGQETDLSPTTRRVMSEQSAATLRTMMTGVVEDRGASGFLSKIPAFKGQVAAKTGTASVPENGRYGNDTIDSFVGFLPASHPQFTMLVVIRKPHHCTSNGKPDGHATECEGAYVAAPVFRQLSLLMIDDWKIEP